MKKYDILVIGGGPAGVQAAISARNTNPEKTIALIRKEQKALIPCGIPYIFHSLNSVDENILPDGILHKNHVDLIIGEVVERRGMTIILKDQQKLAFRKLVLAAGSIPVIPKIPGIDLHGVHVLTKSYDDLVELRREVISAARVLIVGGGYVGVELADELAKMGKSVIMVEQMASILPTSVDPEFSSLIKEKLEEKGVEIKTGTAVEAFVDEKTDRKCVLQNGQSIQFDLAILSIGFSPNRKLPEILGLDCDKRYGVLVDEYMRTSDENIFAAGDCAVHRDCYTGNCKPTMLASVAMSQGRLSGANLFSINLMKTFAGVLGSFATKVANSSIGVTGLTERQAKTLGIEYVVGRAETVDHHPGKLPNTSKVVVKLIFASHSHVLLGAQAFGGDSTGELINMLSVIIQNKMTDMEIDTIQIGTHPLLTASPLAYPVITATVDAIMKWYPNPDKPENLVDLEIEVDPNSAGMIN